MGLSQGEVLCWEMLDGAQAAQREWKLQSSVHPLLCSLCYSLQDQDLGWSS